MQTLCDDDIKKMLSIADPAHDWEHIVRVRRTAVMLAEETGANKDLTLLVATLHEVGDPKISSEKTIEDILSPHEYPKDIIERVSIIVPKISYRKIIEGVSNLPPEDQIICDCVSDADKLDAMGAIGIARVFAFSGATNRPLYNYDDPPRLKCTAEEYNKTNGSMTAINHFFEKLLKLDNMMKTKTGKEEARTRSDFMKLYLQTFSKETGLLMPL